MKQYLYETHLHTYPVSKCARATVRENLEFYKSLGYDGVFITNHFIDGNINFDRSLPYKEQMEFYFSDYEEGVAIGREIGISVFLGIETSLMGTDFLVYGLDKAWFLNHPEIRDMQKSDALSLFARSGALIIQAHPFREAGYINHIRLFPRHVHGVEVYNGGCTDFENDMAELYREGYGLIAFAGSDNHRADKQKFLGGVSSSEKIKDELDFIAMAHRGELEIFKKTLDSRNS